MGRESLVLLRAPWSSGVILQAKKLIGQLSCLPRPGILPAGGQELKPQQKIWLKASFVLGEQSPFLRPAHTIKFWCLTFLSLHSDR